MPSDPDAPDEKKGNKGISAYVPSGIVLEEEEVLRAMERDGKGEYIPYIANAKSGNKSGRTLEDIKALENDAKNAVIESVDMLYAGNICPKPSDKTNSPCKYCKYKTACGRSKRGAEVDTYEDD